MAVFISDLTFVFELFAIAAGLVLLDRAAASGGGYTKLAGWLLVVGGIVTALCTGYYWLKYNGQGDFDRAYPPAMMQDMQGMGMMKMMHGNRQGMGMQGGMRSGQGSMDMKGGMMGQQNCPKDTKPEDCPRDGKMMQGGRMSMDPGEGMQQRQRMMQNQDEDSE